MTIRTFALSLLLVVAGAPSTSADTTILIDNFTFKPAAVEVKAGSKVTFKNADDIPHSVVAADGSFRSKALDTNDEAAFILTKVGDIVYSCGLHPFMKGRIKVVP